jgi:hypothetical protein
VSWEADSPPTVAIGAGNAGVISGNTFKRIRTCAVNLHPCAGWVVSNNTIEDVGRDPADGTTAVSAYVFQVYGTTNCIFSDNIVRMKDWTTHSGVRAFYFNQYTDANSVLFPTENNVITDNVVSGIYNGINEQASLGNYFHNNYFFGCTVLVENISNASINSYWDDVNGMQWFKGATKFGQLSDTVIGLKGVQFLDAKTAASVAANFTATHYITAKDSTGATIYIPCRTAAW